MHYKTPACLLLEIVNTCNLSCVFCPQDRRDVQKTIMSEEIFNSAIHQYHEAGGRSVSLTPMQGESFLDPDLLSKLKALRKYNFDSVHLFSNATMLDRFDAQELINSGLTTISFSLAPPEPELYKKITRYDLYSKTFAKLAKFLETFQSMENPSLNGVELSFRSNTPLENIKEMEGYSTYISPYLSDKVRTTCITQYDSWCGAISKEDLVQGMTLRSQVPLSTTPCFNLNYLRVTEDGGLRLCGCRFLLNQDDELAIGHLQEDGLIKSFNSPKAEAIRASFGLENPPAVCKNCAFYTNAMGHNLNPDK